MTNFASYKNQQKNMKIGIIVAMESEKNMIASILEHKHEREEHKQTFIEGTLGAHQVVLLQSGIGKVSAAVGATELINQYKPDYIINSGVAGSLNKEVGVMDIVVAERTVYHDVDCFSDNELGQIQGFPTYFTADQRLLQSARQIVSAHKIHFGLTCTGDQFISRYDDLKKIIDNFPQGLAVDMESNAIAQVCYMYDTPFVSLRIVSDTPGINDHEQSYLNFWEEAPKTSFNAVRQLLENIK